MPNATIEHSKGISEIQLLIQTCHEELVNSGLFKLPTIKVRALGFDHFLVGGEANKAFVVVNVSIMPGRTKEQKFKLGENLHKKIMQTCNDLGLDAATSVAIRETPEGLYFKNP